MARAGRGARPPAAARTSTAPESPPSGSSVWRRLPFLLLALLAALYCGTGMVQAVDTWWGLAAGRQITEHGVGDVDPFSFNTRPAAASQLPASASTWQRFTAWAHPTGWINQNWLTHVLLYELTAAATANALVVFRFAVYLISGVLLFAAARVHGAGVETAATATAFALIACRPFAEFRAQDVSVALAATLLVLLAVAVHRVPGVLWAVAPLITLWSNAHGGYIYALLALVVYAGAWVLARCPGGRWAGLGLAGARSAAAVALVGAVLAVLASPFHLANLTHPLEITVGPDAAVWRRVNEWLPALGPGRLGEVAPFLAMLAVTAATLAIALRPAGATPARGGRGPVPEGTPGAVRIDLGGTLLAAVTVAMALRSRRFVPLAALAMAPVLAVAATEALRRAGRRARGRWAPALPWAVAASAVVLAGYWAVRWDRSYRQPWPFATSPVSLFERMTWGHRRSGHVGEFLLRNGVAGRAFNFWEEGGFLEWVQEPRRGFPDLPLKLFIDGRAQEAFPAAVVRTYLELAVGGPAGVDSTSEGRAPSPQELGAMAEWVDARLKRDGIWVAFLPAERRGDGAARALSARPNWKVVYLDPSQGIVVDSDDPRGQRLDAAVAGGTAAFPDEATRLLTLAARSSTTRDPGERRGALSAAARSFALRPSAAAVAVALQAGATAELRGETVALLKGVIDEYRRDERRMLRENGFFERATAVIAAASFLESEARQSGAVADAEEMATLVASVRQTRDRVLRAALWWG